MAGGGGHSAPGGWFVVFDWLIAHDGDPLEMVRHRRRDLGFAMVSSYRKALEAAGFTDVMLVILNLWKTSDQAQAGIMRL
jgi:hypothetical protein